MKTSQWLISTVLLSTSCFSIAHAGNDEQAQRGFYVGADFGFYNEMTLGSGSGSIEEESDSGDFSYHLVAGYEFDTHDVIKLGVEAEYRHIPKVNYDDILEMDGHSFSINIKPKFIVEYDAADVYVSLLAGLSNMDIEAKIAGSSASESDIGYNLGAEFGVIINRNIDLNIGYRRSEVDIESLDITTDSVYLGLRYFF